ncbi:MAG: CHASE3 domain-containing protein [Anaerolineaceae bacterium]|nr:CHASE3 domain-containing protein [Anaerolineaceae bacterium]
MKIRMKLILGFVGILIIMTSVSVVSYSNTTKRDETIALVEHSNKVIKNIEEVYLGLTNAETGFRGYLITGDAEFLEPYNAGLLQYQQALNNLLGLTSDNPEQIENFEKVKIIAEDWQNDWVAPGLTLREKANGAQASDADLQAVIAEGRGKAAMEEMRSEIFNITVGLSSLYDPEALIYLSYITEDIISQESGMYGYIITGEENFLDPYNLGIKKLENHINRLELYLKDDPKRLEMLSLLESDHQIWLLSAEEWIAAKKIIKLHPITVVDISDYISTGGGKLYMDEMRNILDTSIQIEEELLVTRMESDHKTALLGKMVILIGNIAAISIGIIIALIQSGAISKTINELIHAADVIAEKDLPALVAVTAAISNGDLTSRFEVQSERVTVNAKDETGQLAQSFNQMIERLKNTETEISAMVQSLQNLIGQVIENAMSLDSASNQLAEASDQTGTVSNQITQTFQEIASSTQRQTESVTQTATIMDLMTSSINDVSRGAQEQAQAVSDASNITNQISTSIQQVASIADAVTKGSKVAADAAQDGSMIVEKTINGLQRIREKVGVSAVKVQEMGERSNQIGIIVETIEDIASQTNLLALNAAIEAARAGEHGKGFAVVADEVRKLAERSASATKEISELVKVIRSTVEEAVDAMQAGSHEVDTGVSEANQAGVALNRILEASEDVLKQAEQASDASAEMTAAASELVNSMDSVSAVVEENTAATEEMSAASNEVSESIAGIAAISEENSASVEEVSASAEELTAQAEEVAISAQSLRVMSQDLMEAISSFKLSEEDEEESIIENDNEIGFLEDIEA